MPRALAARMHPMRPARSMVVEGVPAVGSMVQVEQVEQVGQGGAMKREDGVMHMVVPLPVAVMMGVH